MNGLPRRRFALAVREALLVLAAGTGLGLAHGALTDDGIFRTTAAPSAAASLEERAAMPDSPMMVSVSEAEELFRAGQALFVDARSEFDYGRQTRKPVVENGRGAFHPAQYRPPIKSAN